MHPKNFAERLSPWRVLSHLASCVSAVEMEEVGVEEAKEEENKMEITAEESEGKGETVTVTYKRRFYILALFSFFTMEQGTLS